MEDDGFKTCPFCKEKIRKEAVKCRFCGEWLEQNGQTQPSADPAPTLPKLEELPKIATDEVQRKKPPKIKREIPPKTLYWISAALLIACGYVIFSGLNGSHWNQSNPGERSYEITKMIIGLVVFLFFAGSAASSARKGYKLFIFSVVCVICTAIGAYNFFDARHKAQEKAAESDRQLANELTSLQEFFKNGAVGDIPEFKPTGDKEEDALLQTLNDFYRKYVQIYREMNGKLQALDERSIFDDLLLTNKPSLESEIRKRIVGQQIIEAFTTSAVLMLEDARKRCKSQNVSDDGALKSFDESVPQFKAMFASWIKIQKNDQEFLQFLDDNFTDYKLEDGKIMFGSSTNVQKYAELAKNVQDAITEAEGFQTRALTKNEEARAKLLQPTK